MFFVLGFVLGCQTEPFDLQSPAKFGTVGPHATFKLLAFGRCPLTVALRIIDGSVSEAAAVFLTELAA